MNSNRALGETDRTVIGIVYELMVQRGSWPTFTAVDLKADRDLGIEDAQAALAAVPRGYLTRPWRAHGFYDNDDVRLTLRGIAECEGGQADLETLLALIKWVVELESHDSGGPEDNLIATGQAFAEHLGLTLKVPASDDIDGGTAAGEPDSDDIDGGTAAGEPDSDDIDGGTAADEPETASVPVGVAEARGRLVRVRLLADLLPRFWSGLGWQSDTPWLWQYTVDRRQVRPYRRINTLQDLFVYVDQVERERLADYEALIGAGGLETVSPPVEPPLVERLDELAVLLTMLREEIADAAAELLRHNRFDDAIFAAFRRVEHEVQQRSGNPSIGDGLFKQAFQDMATPIRISARSQDADRMIELFSGAVGLFKGDRSHKDRPLLPCRSRRECLRLLAHASTLLDLLDRDVDRAPNVRGHEHHQGDTLTLWVERAGAQVDVWLDEATLLEKISYRSGTLVVSVAAVPPGEHLIHLVEGTRQGIAQPVWITLEPGRSTWYRVMEVNLPLYADADGRRPHEATGMRLAVLEAGVVSERIVPTRVNYQVGHYVDWQWTGGVLTGEVWIRDRFMKPPRKLSDGATLFNGQPVAPAHAERLMRISIEPPDFQLRVGDKVPARVLRHYTDGVAQWTEQLDDPTLTPDDPDVAFFKGGALIAKTPGRISLRCQHSGFYAEAHVDVASHPRGTATELMTGLPPVSGIAWTPQGLLISSRFADLYRIGKDGRYRLAAAIPQPYLNDRQTDNIFARSDGELALRVLGERRVLVLHCSDGYSSSHWVTPPGDGVPMAMTWDGDDLVIALHDGDIHRVSADGTSALITTLDAHPIDITRTDDCLLVLCGPGTRSLNPEPKPGHHGKSSLWQVPHATPNEATDLLADTELNNLAGLVWAEPGILLSDFHGGRIVSLSDQQLSTIASGLVNPTQLAVSDSGDVYVAEFGARKVLRILA